MKHITLLLFVGLFIGCIDINLKNELPELNYFDLDKLKSKTTEHCEAYNFIALGNIDIPSEYKINKVLYKTKNKVSYLTNIRLIKPLNESLESMIIKEFNSKCIKTIIPPFSSLNIDSYLKIKVLDFSINQNDKEAIFAIFYQISSQGSILQSGILDSKISFNDNALESKLNALHDVSFDVINKLANRIIPK